jgi:hypothetical protein
MFDSPTSADYIGKSIPEEPEKYMNATRCRNGIFPQGAPAEKKLRQVNKP